MKDGKISLNRGFVLAGLTEKRLPPLKSRTVDPDSFEPTAEELVERLAAAVDPEPVEKVTRNDSRPPEDLDLCFGCNRSQKIGVLRLPDFPTLRLAAAFALVLDGQVRSQAGTGYNPPAKPKIAQIVRGNDRKFQR